jgi:hypothetical protein
MSRTSLARIKDDSEELSGLVASSGTLFIYAATAVRYITIGGEDYKPRLSAMLTHGQRSINKFETEIDSLYVHVLEKVCEDKELHEVADMRNVLSIDLIPSKSVADGSHYISITGKQRTLVFVVAHLSKNDWSGLGHMVVTPVHNMTKSSKFYKILTLS